MQILLRNSVTGQYYAGENHWTTRRDHALDLRQVERAIRINKEQNLGATDVILGYHKPPCTLTLPISEPTAVFG